MMMMMTNRIEVGEHFCRYRCANGREFLFDKCDLTFFRDKICTVDERGYVTTNRKKDLVSHLLLNVGNEVVVDHINGNPFDNRRCNLRIASNVQNHWNYRLSGRNTTGYKGIYKDKHADKFHARICEHGRRHYLGAYATAEEAAQTYDKAARKFFGEFATLNFPKKNEQGCNLEREAV